MNERTEHQSGEKHGGGGSGTRRPAARLFKVKSERLKGPVKDTQPRGKRGPLQLELSH